MPDTPPPSTGRRTGRISAEGPSLRRHDGVRRAPEPVRSGRGGAGFGWGGAGTLPRVAEREVRGLAVFTPEHSDGADPRGLLPRAGRRRSPPRSGGQNRGDPAEASGTV